MKDSVESLRHAPPPDPAGPPPGKNGGAAVLSSHRAADTPTPLGVHGDVMLEPNGTGAPSAEETDAPDEEVTSSTSTEEDTVSSTAEALPDSGSPDTELASSSQISDVCDALMHPGGAGFATTSTVTVHRVHCSNSPVLPHSNPLPSDITLPIIDGSLQPQAPKPTEVKPESSIGLSPISSASSWDDEEELEQPENVISDQNEEEEEASVPQVEHQSEEPTAPCETVLAVSSSDSELAGQSDQPVECGPPHSDSAKQVWTASSKEEGNDSPHLADSTDGSASEAEGSALAEGLVALQAEINLPQPFYSVSNDMGNDAPPDSTVHLSISNTCQPGNVKTSERTPPNTVSLDEIPLPSTVSFDKIPSPCTVSTDEIPIPSAVLPDRSPSPSVVLPDRSSSPSVVLPDRSSSPSVVLPDRSSSPSVVLPDRSSSPSALSPDRIPSSIEVSSDGIAASSAVPSDRSPSPKCVTSDRSPSPKFVASDRIPSPSTVSSDTISSPSAGSSDGIPPSAVSMDEIPLSHAERPHSSPSPSVVSSESATSPSAISSDIIPSPVTVSSERIASPSVSSAIETEDDVPSDTAPLLLPSSVESQTLDTVLPDRLPTSASPVSSLPCNSAQGNSLRSQSPLYSTLDSHKIEEIKPMKAFRAPSPHELETNDSSGSVRTPSPNCANPFGSLETTDSNQTSSSCSKTCTDPSSPTGASSCLSTSITTEILIPEEPLQNEINRASTSSKPSSATCFPEKLLSEIPVERQEELCSVNAVAPREVNTFSDLPLEPVIPKLGENEESVSKPALSETKPADTENTTQQATAVLDDASESSNTPVETEPEGVKESNTEVEPEIIKESNAEVEPESVKESNAEVEPESVKESNDNVEPDSIKNSNAEPEPESIKESNAEVESESIKESNAEVEPECVQKINAEVEPENIKESNAEAEPESSKETNAVSEPESFLESSAESEPESVTKSIAEAEPESNAAAEPESNAEAEPESNVAEPECNAEAEPESNAEAEPESNAEAEPESNAEAEPESNAEAEPESNAEVEPGSKAEADPESVKKSFDEVEPEGVKKSNAEAQIPTEFNPVSLATLVNTSSASISSDTVKNLKTSTSTSTSTSAQTATPVLETDKQTKPTASPSICISVQTSSAPESVKALKPTISTSSSASMSVQTSAAPQAVERVVPRSVPVEVKSEASENGQDLCVRPKPAKPMAPPIPLRVSRAAGPAPRGPLAEPPNEMALNLSAVRDQPLQLTKQRTFPPAEDTSHLAPCGLDAERPKIRLASKEKLFKPSVVALEETCKRMLPTGPTGPAQAAQAVQAAASQLKAHAKDKAGKQSHNIPQSVLAKIPPTVLAKIPPTVLANIPPTVLQNIPSEVLASIPPAFWANMGSLHARAPSASAAPVPELNPLQHKGAAASLLKTGADKNSAPLMRPFLPPQTKCDNSLRAKSKSVSKATSSASASTAAAAPAAHVSANEERRLFSSLPKDTVVIPTYYVESGKKTSTGSTASPSTSLPMNLSTAHPAPHTAAPTTAHHKTASASTTAPSASKVPHAGPVPAGFDPSMLWSPMGQLGPHFMPPGLVQGFPSLEQVQMMNMLPGFQTDPQKLMAFMAASGMLPGLGGPMDPQKMAQMLAAGNQMNHQLAAMMAAAMIPVDPQVLSQMAVINALRQNSPSVAAKNQSASANQRQFKAQTQAAAKQTAFNSKQAAQRSLLHQASQRGMNPTGPRGVSPAGQRDLGPSQRGSSPAQRGSSPAQRGPSPAQRGPSPALRGSSPAQRVSSPAQRVSSPAQRGSSPAQRGPSPAGSGPSPAGRGPSPGQRGPSPAGMGPSPGQRGPSPAHQAQRAPSPVTRLPPSLTVAPLSLLGPPRTTAAPPPAPAPPVTPPRPDDPSKRYKLGSKIRNVVDGLRAKAEMGGNPLNVADLLPSSPQAAQEAVTPVKKVIQVTDTLTIELEQGSGDRERPRPPVPGLLPCKPAEPACQVILLDKNSSAQPPREDTAAVCAELLENLIVRVEELRSVQSSLKERHPTPPAPPAMPVASAATTTGSTASLPTGSTTAGPVATPSTVSAATGPTPTAAVMLAAAQAAPRKAKIKVTPTRAQTGDTSLRRPPVRALPPKPTAAPQSITVTVSTAAATPIVVSTPSLSVSSPMLLSPAVSISASVTMTPVGVGGRRPSVDMSLPCSLPLNKVSQMLDSCRRTLEGGRPSADMPTIPPVLAAGGLEIVPMDAVSPPPTRKPSAEKVPVSAPSISLSPNVSLTLATRSSSSESLRREPDEPVVSVTLESAPEQPETRQPLSVLTKTELILHDEELSEEDASVRVLNRENSTSENDESQDGRLVIVEDELSIDIETKVEIDPNVEMQNDRIETLAEIHLEESLPRVKVEVGAIAALECARTDDSPSLTEEESSELPPLSRSTRSGKSLDPAPSSKGNTAATRKSSTSKKTSKDLVKRDGKKLSASSSKNSSKKPTTGSSAEESERKTFVFNVESEHIIVMPDGQKLYTCDICMGVYQRAFSLKRHYLRSHINYAHLTERDISNCGIVVGNKMAVQVEKNAKVCMQNSKITTVSSEEPLTPGAASEEGDSDNEEEEEEIGGVFQCYTCGESFDHKEELREHLPGHKMTEGSEGAASTTTSPSERAAAVAAAAATSAAPAAGDVGADSEPLPAPEEPTKPDDQDEDEEGDEAAGLSQERASPLLCLFCDQTYATDTLRRRHQGRVHQRAAKKSRKSKHLRYACRYCQGKEPALKDLTGLFQHMCSEHQDVYFACTICEVRFESADALSEHESSVHVKVEEDAALSMPVETFAEPVAEPELQVRSKISPKPDDASGVEQFQFKCTVCRKMFVSEQNLHRHQRLAHDTGRGKKSKKKQRSAEEDSTRERQDKVDPETLFFSRISHNIRENLLHHLDGKLDSQELFEREEVEAPLVPPLHGSAPRPLLLSAAAPGTSAPVQRDEPREKLPPIKVKNIGRRRSSDGLRTWEKFAFPKNYDGKGGLTSYVRDLSHVDIYSQVTMRQNAQRLSEETQPGTSTGTSTGATTRSYRLRSSLEDTSAVDFPSVLSLRQSAEGALSRRTASAAVLERSMLSVSHAQPEPHRPEQGRRAKPPKQPAADFLNATWRMDAPPMVNGCAELSGEWVRPKNYLCGACESKFTNLYELEDHKWNMHPNVWCTHFEFDDSARVPMNAVGVKSPGELHRRAIRSAGTIMSAPAVPATLLGTKCTKCQHVSHSTGELHRHMLDCAGDTSWQLLMVAASPGSSGSRRNRKWRPFGSRRRRHQGRRGLKRNIPNTPQRPRSYNPKTRGGDADTIQRMIANLPAKRSTRRVIQFKDDEIKTRSQATMASTRLLRKRFKVPFPVSQSALHKASRALVDRSKAASSSKPGHMPRARALRTHSSTGAVTAAAAAAAVAAAAEAEDEVPSEPAEASPPHPPPAASPAPAEPAGTPKQSPELQASTSSALLKNAGEVSGDKSKKVTNILEAMRLAMLKSGPNKKKKSKKAARLERLLKANQLQIYQQEEEELLSAQKAVKTTQTPKEIILPPAPSLELTTVQFLAKSMAPNFCSGCQRTFCNNSNRDRHLKVCPFLLQAAGEGMPKLRKELTSRGQIRTEPVAIPVLQPSTSVANASTTLATAAEDKGKNSMESSVADKLLFGEGLSDTSPPSGNKKSKEKKKHIVGIRKRVVKRGSQEGSVVIKESVLVRTDSSSNETSESETKEKTEEVVDDVFDQQKPAVEELDSTDRSSRNRKLRKNDNVDKPPAISTETSIISLQDEVIDSKLKRRSGKAPVITALVKPIASVEGSLIPAKKLTRSRNSSPQKVPVFRVDRSQSSGFADTVSVGSPSDQGGRGSKAANLRGSTPKRVLADVLDDDAEYDTDEFEELLDKMGPEEIKKLDYLSQVLEGEGSDSSDDDIPLKPKSTPKTNVAEDSYSSEDDLPLKPKTNSKEQLVQPSKENSSEEEESLASTRKAPKKKSSETPIKVLQEIATSMAESLSDLQSAMSKTKGKSKKAKNAEEEATVMPAPPIKVIVKVPKGKNAFTMPQPQTEDDDVSSSVRRRSLRSRDPSAESVQSTSVDSQPESDSAKRKVDTELDLHAEASIKSSKRRAKQDDPSSDFETIPASEEKQHDSSGEKSSKAEVETSLKASKRRGKFATETPNETVISEPRAPSVIENTSTEEKKNIDQLKSKKKSRTPSLPPVPIPEPNPEAVSELDPNLIGELTPRLSRKRFKELSSTPLSADLKSAQELETQASNKSSKKKFKSKSTEPSEDSSQDSLDSLKGGKKKQKVDEAPTESQPMVPATKSKKKVKSGTDVSDEQDASNEIKIQQSKKTKKEKSPQLSVESTNQQTKLGKRKSKGKLEAQDKLEESINIYFKDSKKRIRLDESRAEAEDSEEIGEQTDTDVSKNDRLSRSRAPATAETSDEAEPESLVDDTDQRKSQSAAETTEEKMSDKSLKRKVKGESQGETENAQNLVEESDAPVGKKPRMIEITESVESDQTAEEMDTGSIKTSNLEVASEVSSEVATEVASEAASEAATDDDPSETAVAPVQIMQDIPTASASPTPAEFPKPEIKKRNSSKGSHFFCTVCQRHYSTAFNLHKHYASLYHKTNLAAKTKEASEEDVDLGKTEETFCQNVSAVVNPRESNIKLSVPDNVLNADLGSQKNSSEEAPLELENLAVEVPSIRTNEVAEPPEITREGPESIVAAVETERGDDFPPLDSQVSERRPLEDSTNKPEEDFQNECPASKTATEAQPQPAISPNHESHQQVREPSYIEMRYEQQRPQDQEFEVDQYPQPQSYNQSEYEHYNQRSDQQYQQSAEYERLQQEAPQQHQQEPSPSQQQQPAPPPPPPPLPQTSQHQQQSYNSYNTGNWQGADSGWGPWRIPDLGQGYSTEEIGAGLGLGLGSILDSVNQVLSGEGGMPDPLPMYADYASLQDLQHAIGANDEEMAVLRQLGEGSLRELIGPPPGAPVEEADLLDLDNQKKGLADRHALEPSTSSYNQSTSSSGRSSASSVKNSHGSSSSESGQTCSSGSLPPRPKGSLSTGPSLNELYEDKQMWCPLCHRRFLGLAAMKAHMERFHAQAGDGRRFERRPLALSAEGSSEPRLCCSVCKEMVVDEKALDRHNDEMHTPGREPQPQHTRVHSEGLRTQMSHALGGLLDRALKNYLSKSCGPNASNSVETDKSRLTLGILSKLALRHQSGNLSLPSGSGVSIGTIGGGSSSTTDMLVGQLVAAKLGMRRGSGSSVRRRHSGASSPGTGSATDGSWFCCPVCQERFQYEGAMKRHLLNSHKRPYEMQDDSLSAPESRPDSPMEMSMDPAVGLDGAFLCSVCGINFKTPIEVLEHQRAEHQLNRRTSREDDIADPDGEDVDAEAVEKAEKWMENHTKLQSSPKGRHPLGKDVKNRKVAIAVESALLERTEEMRIKAEAALRELNQTRKPPKGSSKEAKWGVDAVKFTVAKEPPLVGVYGPTLENEARQISIPVVRKAPNNAPRFSFLSERKKVSSSKGADDCKEKEKIDVYDFDESTKSSSSKSDKGGDDRQTSDQFKFDDGDGAHPSEQTKKKRRPPKKDAQPRKTAATSGKLKGEKDKKEDKEGVAVEGKPKPKPKAKRTPVKKAKDVEMTPNSMSVVPDQAKNDSRKRPNHPMIEKELHQQTEEPKLPQTSPPLPVATPVERPQSEVGNFKSRSPRATWSFENGFNVSPQEELPLPARKQRRASTHEATDYSVFDFSSDESTDEELCVKADAVPARPRSRRGISSPSKKVTRVVQLVEEDWTWLDDSDESEKERKQRSARRRRARRARQLQRHL